MFRSYYLPLVYIIIRVLVIIIKFNTVVGSYRFIKPATIKEKVINTRKYI